MSRQKKESTSTSRRQFTKGVITAAVAAPIATAVACKTDNANNTNRAEANQSPEPCELREHDGNGYSIITWERMPPEDHIPPMGLEGGGSVIIDSKNIFRETPSGSGSFTYDEDPNVIPNNLRYGDIESVTIITENASKPYLSHSYYNGFQPGTQLWVWYQNILTTPTGDDTDFDNIGADPDLKINGGRAANGFRIVVRQKKFDYEKSHRKNRPHRYRHVNISGERHFRVGKWQFLNAANQVLFQENGADNYRFYIEFGHYQP